MADDSKKDTHKDAAADKADQVNETAPAHTATNTATAAPETTARLGRLKLAFLYVLIIGLTAAAITSVIALLIGNFSAAIGKSLLTILVFFSHSLLILGILWADRYNEVGRKLLPTSIIVLVFASMISTTLGTWEIIDAELAWRLEGLYFLLLGAVFTIIGILNLRVQQTAVQLSSYISIGLVSSMVLAVTPWILDVVERFDPLYFRIVAALAILSATSLIITVILRSIAVGRHAELGKKVAPKQSTPGGLLAIYITVGAIAAMVWFSGFIGFIVSAANADSPARSHYQTYDDDQYDYDSSHRYR